MHQKQNFSYDHFSTIETYKMLHLVFIPFRSVSTTLYKLYKNIQLSLIDLKLFIFKHELSTKICRESLDIPTFPFLDHYRQHYRQYTQKAYNIQVIYYLALPLCRPKNIRYVSLITNKSNIRNFYSRYQRYKPLFYCSRLIWCWYLG